MTRASMSSALSNYGPLGANSTQDPLETQLSIKQTNPTSPHPEDPEQPRLRSSSSSSVRNSLDELNPSQSDDKPYKSTASSDSQNPLRSSRRTNRHLDPARKLRGQFETILVYGHILEAVAAFTCLLVLFNVVVLSNRILEVSPAKPQSSGNSNELIRVFGAVVYGVTVYVGLVTQLISLGFLLIMIRTRFKHNQAGVPKPDCTYSNILLITHLVVGLHWLGVASWLFIDPGYVDCFQLYNFGGTVEFAVRLHRLCDLVWLEICHDQRSSTRLRL
ncbi:hypothetical protein DSO57_1001861 [Entomophthora muscae]|uniref:Uncharacterized protein n=1 Tax=Entomophthora muscae TaxID=34485 RepID=A0ACC2SXU4_9FUNG|nr:hypothetical protein DSO57_1001861 [Entomophthora muscae]